MEISTKTNVSKRKIMKIMGSQFEFLSSNLDLATLQEHINECSVVILPYDAVSYSIVEYKTSLRGYLVAILSILLFGFLSIILMPFLVSLTK